MLFAEASAASRYLGRPSTNYRGPVAGRIGPITNRWRPGDSFAVNRARTDLTGYREQLDIATERMMMRRQIGYQNPNLLPPGQRALVGREEYYAGNRGVMYPGLGAPGGEFTEGRPFLGGYSDDYVSSTMVGTGTRSPEEWRYAGVNTPMQHRAYGQPIYREGDQALYPGKMRLTPDKIRQWQAFFQLNGFKTGPAGFWTEFEMNAMKAFMTMANGTPGGGMTVENLQSRVMAEIEAGRLEAGALGQMLSESGGGAGGAMGPTEPYTETTVEREVTEFSTDEGLAAIQGLVAKEIGRSPTEAEVKAYIKQLNARFRADPTVITSVVTTNPLTGQVDSTRTVDESNVSPEGQALTFVEEGLPEGERKEYQSARYMEAIARELGL